MYVGFPDIIVAWSCLLSAIVSDIVFFDDSIGSEPLGFISFELFLKFQGQEKTSVLWSLEREDLVTTVRLWPYHPEQRPISSGYNISCFHRHNPDFMWQCSNFICLEGSGGQPIYGEKVGDKNFILKHTGAGILSMADAELNASGPEFFFCITDTEWLEAKQVISGRMKRAWVFLDLRMTRPVRIWSLHTVDKSNTFDLCFTAATRPFLLSCLKAHLHPSCVQHP